MKRKKSESVINGPLIKSTIHFPIVGIGASAGGLEAFRSFIREIPENSGMAYVLVQHLDPKHDSILPELLQKVTKIPVVQAKDEIKIEPNIIYVIPSNKMMVANDGVLQLTARPDKAKNILNLPVDLFFSSLAVDYQANAIGVVLSGSASDGTLGLKAIKDNGGITFAQDEGSSAFEGMPNNAVKAGVVDFILPPEKIPQKIIEIISITNGNKADVETIPPKDEDFYRQILSLLRLRKGTDFTYYKQSTILRRILRRIAINKNEHPQAYLKFLRENVKEQDILYQDLLIPVTSFFRDHAVFESLTEIVFPQIINNKSATEPIRLWIAGCSTGEEVYTLAISLIEFLGDKKEKVQIFATDINEPAIAKARTGIYKKSELGNLTPGQLQDFFIPFGGGFQVKKRVRERCVFAVHNFLKDPPFSKMDLISCRNVLIYMEPYLQKKALTTFHYALNPKGFLLLGKSETISSVPDLFVHSQEEGLRNTKIFNRKDVTYKIRQITSQRIGSNFHRPDPPGGLEQVNADFQKTADEIMLNEFTPAGVVVNDAMDIVHFRGKKDQYLKQPPGKPSHHLLKLAIPGLAFVLRNILHQLKDKKQVTKKNIPVNINGANQNISIQAMVLPKTIEPHYLLLFHDNNVSAQELIKPNKAANKSKSAGTAIETNENRIRQLEQELLQTREDMRTITEEQHAANEELQSTNEELLSSSEELQSLNEELETSAEELQSTNEELTVVNQEIIELNKQISVAKDYSEAIISTITEPLLVLDKHMRVKSANRSYYTFFDQNEEETLGRSLYELGNKQWDIAALRSQMQKVLLEKSTFSNFEVIQKFSNIGERVMLLNAREIIISGFEKLVLLAIVDITELRRNELELQRKEKEIVLAQAKIDSYEAANAFLENAFLKAPAAISMTRGAHHEIVMANEMSRQLSGNRNIVGKTVRECFPELEGQGYFEMLDEVYKSGKTIIGNEAFAKYDKGNEKLEEGFFNFVYQPAFDLDGKINGILTYAVDITEQVVARKKTEESEAQFHTLANNIQNLAWIANADGWIFWYNDRWFEFTGTTPKEMEGWGWKSVHDPQKLPVVLEEWQRCINTEQPFEMVFPLLGANKKYRQFLTRVMPVRDVDGNLIRWVGTNTDINEQETFLETLEESVKIRTLELEQANQELQQKNQEIALSIYNRRFLTEFSEKFTAYTLHNEFFNSLVQFIAETTKLDFVFVGKLKENEKNEFFIETISLTAFGKPVDNIIYPLPDGPCEQVIRGTLYSYPEKCRITFPKNKTIAQFEVEGYIGYPLYDAFENAVGIIVVMHQQAIEDAETVASVLKIVARRAEIELERIHQEEQLVQNNKILEEKNETLVQLNQELESFAYVSSHDLQEPLRKIQTFANRIIELDSQNLSDKGNYYFNRMQEAAHRMQTLIQDLLTISRVKTDERKLEVIHLNKIVDEVISDLKETIEDKQASIKVTEMCEAPIIHFQFRQLLYNLLSNSLKFSKPDRPLTIFIKSAIVKGHIIKHEKLLPEKFYCHIQVKDNGIGFASEYSEKILELFQRLHSKEQYEGTGIGLAIVKKIVENHNGIILASGEAGIGATFDIYIPAFN